jgi:hypothetical protein
LVVGEQDVVSIPLNCRRRIGFHVTLEIGVELQGLADALSNDLDGRRELDFDVNVSSSTLVK